MACSSSATQRRILADELADHADARRTGDVAGAWRALERAHIVSQPLLGQHMRVHMIMLGFAFWLRQPRELVGQFARLALAPLGAVTGHTMGQYRSLRRERLSIHVGPARLRD